MPVKNIVLNLTCWLLATGLALFSLPCSSLAQTATNPASSDSIARLVDQLGSRTFLERDEATKALQKIGTKALPPLREAAKKGKDLEIRRRASLLVDQIENSLEALLEFYCELGLPLPPAGARLVRFETGWSGSEPGGKTIHYQAIGFVLHPAKEKKPPLLLVGTEEYERPTDEDQYRGKLPLIDVDPDEAPPEQVRAQWMGTGFEVNAGLATALQCKAEGYDGFARILWDRCAKAEAEADNCVFHHPANLSSRKAVAQLAWAHYGNELSAPKSDRQAIVKKIRALMKAEPSIGSKENQELLHSLELTMLPSRATAGSVERMIDDLSELSGGRKFSGDRDVDVRYQRLCDMGFAAAPALIEHLGDPRFTRVMWRPFHHGPPRLRRIGDLVRDLLYGIAGLDDIHKWRNENTDLLGAKEDARRWFAQAQMTGEEAFYVQHLFPADPKDERFNSGMLRLIAVKYPNQLPAIYRKILDTDNQLTSWPAATAIVESAMPRSEKITLFTYATKNAKSNHREAALWALKRLEKDKTKPEDKQGR